MLHRIVAALALLALSVVLLIATWPQLVGLERTQYVAQVVSFRGLMIAIAGVVIVVLLVLCLRFRRFRRFGASASLLLLVFGLAGSAILASRGFGDSTFARKTVKDLTVVQWNTLGGGPGAPAIAKLALDSGADIVSLPETTEHTADAVAAILNANGQPMTVHTIAFNHIAKSKSTSVLTSPALGSYSIDTTIGNTSTVPTVVLRSDNGSGPVIVAVHTVAPLPRVLPKWVADLDYLKKLCTDSNVIMTGDFNATLDHLARLGGMEDGTASTIGGCTDAALQSKNAALGTWPTSLPALLGAPIDHVLATHNWRVSGMRVVTDLDGAGSDHRPIVVQLSPRG